MHINYRSLEEAIEQAHWLIMSTFVGKNVEWSFKLRINI
jgi:hypothetical protein